jgi:hypothetical protein
VQIGTATTPSPTPVANGSPWAGAWLGVSCTVSPVGSGFDLQAQVTTGSDRITITSTPGQGAVTPSSGATAIQARFESGRRGIYSAQDCTIAFAYDGAPVPANPPIASGRIWAHLSCPDAQNSAIVIMMQDGSTTNETCDFEADFLFETCAM